MATGTYTRNYSDLAQGFILTTTMTVTSPDSVTLTGTSISASISLASSLAVPSGQWFQSFVRIVVGNYTSEWTRYDINAGGKTASVSFSIPIAAFTNNGSTAILPVSVQVRESTVAGDYRTLYSKNMFNLIAADYNSNLLPSVDGTWSDVSTNKPSGWTGLIQNISKVLAKVSSSSGKYSATIVSYKISIGTQTGTGSSFTSGVLTTSGEIIMSITATDSRGFSKTTNIAETSVNAYKKPSIASLAVNRCTSAGVSDDEGLYASVLPVFSYDIMNNTNTLTTALYYREVGASSWVSAGTVVNNTRKTIGGALSNDKSYQIRLVITDKVYSVEYISVLDVSFYTMDFLTGGKGIAFGKAATQTGFDCNMAALFRSTAGFNGTATFSGAASFANAPTFSAPTSTRANLGFATVQATYTCTVAIANLQSKINEFPKYLAGDYIIKVQPGTITGTITIQRFCGPGSLNIKAVDSSGADVTTQGVTTHKVAKFIVQYCNNCGYVNVQGFNATDNAGNSFYLYRNMCYCIVQYCTANGSASATTTNFGLYVVGCAKVQCLGHTSTGMYNAVRCDYSTLYMSSSYGSGNARGFFTVNSTIFVMTATILTATTQFVKANGGHIYFNTTINVTETSTNKNPLSGWVWEKYSDGTAEAWYMQVFSGIINSGWSNGWYYKSITGPSYPFSFKTNPALTASLMANGTSTATIDGSALRVYSNTTPLTSTGVFMVDRNGIATATKVGYIVYHVKGVHV